MYIILLNVTYNIYIKLSIHFFIAIKVLFIFMRIFNNNYIDIKDEYI